MSVIYPGNGSANNEPRSTSSRSYASVASETRHTACSTAGDGPGTLKPSRDAIAESVDAVASWHLRHHLAQPPVAEKPIVVRFLLFQPT